jgi:hypothetical protein
VAAHCPEWRDKYLAERDRWFEVEARVEAAALTRDMLAYLRALVAYETVSRTLAGWAEEEDAW